MTSFSVAVTAKDKAGHTTTATANATISTPTGTITHGSQLTRAMCLPRVPLTTVAGSVNASAYAVNGVVTGKHFTGSVTFDKALTFNDCQFDQPVNTDKGGNKITTLNYCLVSPPSVGDWAVGPNNVNATRCAFEGCSDGIRFENMNMIESWVRTKDASAADHNDGSQAYQASSGGSMLRCNIDGKPSNAAQYGIAYGNAAIFFADNSKGTVEIRDNYLSGGGYTMRLNEAMFYRVTGNIVVKNSWGFGPLTTTNAVSGAFLEWSNNTLSDGTPLNH